MASVLKVDKLDPQSGTALEIGTSGDTITVPTGAGLTVTDEVKTNKISPASGVAFTLGDSGDTFTVPSGATLDISASTLTPPATMPASSGINLTALNATNLGSGTVPTARLGSGTASSSTVLYGDQTYKAEPGGGKILQVDFATYSTPTTSTSGTFTDFWTNAITPTAASSKILLLGRVCAGATGGGADVSYSLKIMRDIEGGGYTLLGNAPMSLGYQAVTDATDQTSVTDQSFVYLDSPSYTLTDVITYKYMIACVHGGTATYNESSSESTMTLLEVAA